MVDRGHRELPIRPDFVGKNLPTRRDETRRGEPRRRHDRRSREHRQGKGGPMNLDELVIRQRTSEARHLLSIADLDRDGILEIMRLSDAFAEVSERPIPKVPALRGRTVATVFMEPSTRTRLSFETAAKRLSADTHDLHGRDLGHRKGRVAARHRRDDRRHGHRRHGDPPPRLRRAAAGDRMDQLRASSTPATAPTSTRPRRCSTATRSSRRSRAGATAQAPGDLSGLRIAIVGDIKHSRVAPLERARLLGARRRGRARGAADAHARLLGGLARHRHR